VTKLNLDGISKLWDILMDAINMDVVRDCMEALIKLNSKISPILLRDISVVKLRREFIRLAMIRLEQSTLEYKQQPHIEQRRIERILTLLMTYCNQCEVASDVKVHSTY
jgi:hypothetical protein